MGDALTRKNKRTRPDRNLFERRDAARDFALDYAWCGLRIGPDQMGQSTVQRDFLLRMSRS